MERLQELGDETKLRSLESPGSPPRVAPASPQHSPPHRISFGGSFPQSLPRVA